jgi:hypothetical protein
MEGLVYPRRHVGLTVAVQAKLMGAYERELHEVLWDEISRQPALFIDIGCAEGYYAVGLARAVPRLKVRAFDIDPLQQALAREMANSNGVGDRVDVRGECKVEDLADLPEGALVLSDCEGAEYDLIDPSRAPALRAATLVIELHEEERPGVSKALHDRLTESHEVVAVPTEARYRLEYPELRSLSQADQLLASAEYRPVAMTWLVCRPRPARNIHA